MTLTVSSRLLAVAVLAAGALASAGAADTTFTDVRLSLDLVPGVDKAKPENGSDIDTDAKAGFGVGLGVQYGSYVADPMGWVAGLQLFDKGAKGDTAGGSAKFNAYGLRIDAGGAYRVMPELHFELTPFFGVGGASVKTDPGGTSGSGLFLDWGLTLGAYYTYQDHWQGGVHLGYEGYSATGNADYFATGTKNDLTLVGNGFVIGIDLGYRL
jgi:hypothetical protein